MIHHPPFVPASVSNSIQAPWSSPGSESTNSRRNKSVFGLNRTHRPASQESFGTDRELSEEDVSYRRRRSRDGSQDQSNSSASTHPHRSDETYDQSFTISSRLRQVIIKRGWFQVTSGILLLLLVIGALIAALVIGLRNANLQEHKRNRINTIPVIIPPAERFIIGSINSQPAQTREFFLVIDERLGKPDDHEKHMLVVNGSFRSILSNSHTSIFFIYIYIFTYPSL